MSNYISHCKSWTFNGWCTCSFCYTFSASYIFENVYLVLRFYSGSQIMFSNFSSCFLPFYSPFARVWTNLLRLKRFFPLVSKQFESMPCISFLLEKWITHKKYCMNDSIFTCIPDIKINLLLYMLETLSFTNIDE